VDFKKGTTPANRREDQLSLWNAPIGSSRLENRQQQHARTFSPSIAIGASANSASRDAWRRDCGRSEVSMLSCVTVYPLTTLLRILAPQVLAPSLIH
jgi:hypothetical protein